MINTDPCSGKDWITLWEAVFNWHHNYEHPVTLGLYLSARNASKAIEYRMWLEEHRLSERMSALDKNSWWKRWLA